MDALLSKWRDGTDRLRTEYSTAQNQNKHVAKSVNIWAVNNHLHAAGLCVDQLLSRIPFKSQHCQVLSLVVLEEGHLKDRRGFCHIQ